MRTKEEEREFRRGCLEQAAFEFAEAYNAGFFQAGEREKEVLIEKAMAFCGYRFSYFDMKWHKKEEGE